MDGSLKTDLFPVITSSSQATAENTCAGYQYDNLRNSGLSCYISEPRTEFGGAYTE